ncbi:NUDIX hydrolase [Paenibacillus mucilaginosus 3016]|uniref:NUDIX hydrolase n=2 Tax=Paenibacillus mucilaginosus TaxID=61624 RepID=H6NK71_9BACL|nr:NUDIX domain-containing protein [Paenibacillus mucilaginosus]AFC31555.1 NUDIX hydrolase [Paenibacillus mucilaginosus 3016]WFA20094.1 NUDIX domain-containing protein [Paenibacillus mucilaginosus]
MEVKFCMSCGAALEDRDVDGTIRRACTKCSFVHWGNYSIGVGALIARDHRYLLVRRAQEPGKGYWTNPGGYIEQLEAIGETIRREVKEEAGVDAVVRRVVALRDQPRAIHNVYIAFEMEYVGGEPKPDGTEVDAAGFYTLEEIASMNVAPFTRWLLHAAANAGSHGLHADEEPAVPLAGYGLFRA